MLVPQLQNKVPIVSSHSRVNLEILFRFTSPLYRTTVPIMSLWWTGRVWGSRDTLVIACAPLQAALTLEDVTLRCVTRRQRNGNGQTNKMCSDVIHQNDPTEVMQDWKGDPACTDSPRQLHHLAMFVPKYSTIFILNYLL